MFLVPKPHMFRKWSNMAHGKNYFHMKKNSIILGKLNKVLTVKEEGHNYFSLVRGITFSRL